MVFIAGGSFAQGSWGFGPKVGLNVATVNGIPNADAKPRIGVSAGVFLDRALTDWFAVETALMFSQQGFEANEEGHTSKVHLNYVGVPVVAKLYMAGGFNLQLGADFQYMVTAREKDNGQYMKLKDQFNKYNADFIVGLAYDFKFGLIVETRYNIGLVDLDNQGDGIRNGMVQLSVGCRF